MNVQEINVVFIDSFCERYKPADETTATDLFSVREIVSMFFESSLQEALDTTEVEKLLLQKGFKKLTNSSGCWWMVENQ